MSDKIQPHHLERKAILYVRQSSAHQVLHNRESSALQYAMRGRLEQLGWSRIETIDEDLGRSAAGNVDQIPFRGARPDLHSPAFALMAAMMRRSTKAPYIGATALVNHQIQRNLHDSNHLRGN